MPQNLFVRLGIGMVLAAGVTFLLFAFMQILVLAERLELDEDQQRVDLQFASQKEDTELKRRDNRPDEPEDVRTPPPPPRIETQKAEKPAEGLASVLGRLPDINPDDVGGQNFDFVVADRDEQPIFRPVNYPQRAAERGTEGSCQVRVDVLPDGSVTNPRAECSSSVFTRQVERDALKWKYQPAVESGEQVIRYNLLVTVDFELAD